MSLPVILEKYRAEINGELRAVLDGQQLPLYAMMRYHLGWTDDKGNPVQKDTGKALRPCLCLFSCEAAGGDYHDALPAAVALEMVHNFSLIHDDIQDDDCERRHRPTVWAIWGKPQAINAGTAMRILASTALWRLQEHGSTLSKQLHIQKRLDEISLRLIEGQYLDISFENRFDITTNDYLTMIESKTGALISGSMEIGAFIGTDNEAQVESFCKIGKNLGLAFQIRDDILGIWGNAGETGKTTGSDIRRRKKSFPVVYALENSNGSTKKALISIYQNGPIDEDTVNKVMEILETVGAREKAQNLVELYCGEARLAFDQLDSPPAARHEMEEMLLFLSGRNY